MISFKKRIDNNGIKFDNFVFYPVPKNACTSLKREIYYIEHKKDFKTKHFFSKKYTIHDYYPSNKFIASKSFDVTLNRICHVRDPLNRFVSGFINRIVNYNDLLVDKENLIENNLKYENIDINYFVTNLEKYLKYSKLTEHHFLPQTYYLGNDPTIFDITKSKNVFKFMSEISGRDINSYKESSLNMKANFTNSLTQESIKKLENFYKDDLTFWKYMKSCN